jgi:5'-deoxynucleotidase YfbR-like HD superfamily hydrolase
MIKTIRKGNAVKRWHTRRMHHYETVGEHTANVLSIVFALTGKPSTDLIGAVLIHDTAEQWTGDVPATAKWEMPVLKTYLDALEDKMMEQNMLKMPDITDEERLVLKWADMLDLCYTCLDELNMGNCAIGEVFELGVDYLRKLPPHPVGLKFLDELIKEKKHVG